MKKGHEVKQNRTRLMLGCLGFLGLLLFQGCGSLESTDYNGETLLKLQGLITLGDNTQVPTQNVHVGIMWMTQKVDTGFVISLSDSLVGSEFPMKFSLDVFNPPPSSTMMNFDDMGPFWEYAHELGFFIGIEQNDVFPRGTQLGTGMVVLWEDTNGSGSFEWQYGPNYQEENMFQVLAHGGPDRIIGGAPEVSIVYIDGPGFTNKFYDLMDEIQGDNLDVWVYLDPEEKLDVGYNLLEATGKIVYLPWHADQFSPVPNNTEIELVISDDLSQSLPHISDWSW